MTGRWLAMAAAAALIGTASAQTLGAPVKAAGPQPPVWPRLERFDGDADFLRYVRRAQEAGGQRYYGGEDEIAVTAVPSIVPAPSPPPPPPSPVANDSAGIVVTGSAAAEPSSITNVQTQGVDEGGIVKQVGRFLIVLQDGRLFVVDTRPGDQAGLAFVGRTDVYRHENADTWYDELLVSGDRVLVTGYSYAEGASEITVFTIGADGRLNRETSYYISSNDYYDIENYATRLVDGNLVIYTPLAVSNINPNRVRWPLIRRWLRDEDRRAVTTEGRPLFDGGDIYKPVQRTASPVVHSVSVCPLGELGAGDELECRTTAFVGAEQREFFVSPRDIFLWVMPNSYDRAIAAPCERAGPAARTLPATIFQAPISGEPPRAIHVRGQPITQLALDATSEEFRALVTWNSGPCNRSSDTEVRYVHIPLRDFSTTPRLAPGAAYEMAPSPGASRYEVRFTDTHVVYGGREGWSSYPPQSGAPLSARVTALSLARPFTATTPQAPHNVIRIERARDNIVLTGYRDDDGLSVSLLSLAGAPRIVSTRVLANRYESEGRSHAFNSLIGDDGAGIMGLPTVTRTWEGGRWWFRSDASDVSYLALDAAGRLAHAGELRVSDDARHPDYDCEVSCVDWYGNTRALFIGERVFALSGTELIEGALRGGRIAELRRLNLSTPPPGGEPEEGESED